MLQSVALKADITSAWYALFTNKRGKPSSTKPVDSIFPVIRELEFRIKSWVADGLITSSPDFNLLFSKFQSGFCFI